jgi:hypothetical protein
MKITVKLRKENNLLLKQLLLQQTGLKVPNVDDIVLFDKNLFDIRLMYDRSSFIFRGEYFAASLLFITVETYSLTTYEGEDYEVFEVIGKYGVSDDNTITNSLAFDRFYSKRHTYNYLLRAMVINDYTKKLAKEKGIYRRRIRLLK